MVDVKYGKYLAKMLSMVRFRNKKCSGTGPNHLVPVRNKTRYCSGTITKSCLSVCVSTRVA